MKDSTILKEIKNDTRVSKVFIESNPFAGGLYRLYWVWLKEGFLSEEEFTSFNSSSLQDLRRVLNNTVNEM